VKLSRSDWDARYTAGQLKLALIGMSNIGKSYTGMRLATHHDFTLIEVDKLIWEALGETDMAAFAAWQGQPYSDGYAAREAESLAMETEATAKAMQSEAKNPLLDTTGSVIYTDAQVRKQLREDWYIVYIEAASEHLQKLKELYFASPKPLAWHGHFKQHAGLTKDESLLASYPDLLSSRHKDYSALADHVISSRDILTDDVSALFNLIKPAR
jgi:shikimate kinase